MSVVGSIPVVGPWLEALGELLKILPILKDKFLKFKNPELNKGLKQIVINGDVNAPVSVYVIEKSDGDISFGNLDRDKDRQWLAKRLEKGVPTRVIETKFNEEYDKYKQFFENTDYPYPFVKLLDVAYRARIKECMYIQELYEKGDRDIAAARKLELNQEEKQFCNLYTEGYIPEVLAYINDIGLIDKNAIQQVLDYVTRYKGVLFVHEGTDKDELLGKVHYYLSLGLNYIAIHGAGINTQTIKKLEPQIQKSANKAGYNTQHKQGKIKKVKRYAVFVYNKKGEKIYGEFIAGSFKGFV
ncbi:MAG TPA: hypothetical protein VJH23_03250 [archaeon]|nr:hypothetical protein [archaeon]